MTAYYVQPEPSASGGEAYWLEGYAVGDAKFAAAQSDGTSTTLAAPTRVQLAGVQSDGTSTSLFGGNRVVAGALVQEPVTATVTGVTRVRQGSIRADGTSDTLISGARIKTAAVVSHSLYAVDDYWDNGYADYGDGSSVRIAANKTTSSGVLSTGSGATFVGVTRVRPLSILAIAEAQVDVSGGITRTNVGVLSDANGVFIINGNATYASSAKSEAASQALAALTIKWLDQAEDLSDWSDQAEDAGPWTDVSEASGIWTDQTTYTEPYVDDFYWVVGYADDIKSFDEYWLEVAKPTSSWTDLSPLT